jgi:RHS repeat-associated protein
VEYYHKDHLGNVRLSFSDLDQDGSIFTGSVYDPGNEITLEKHYYPFGLEQTGAWFGTIAPDNNYRYNGKELDEATGLYDYGARYYDPAVARWGQVDPLADQFAEWSPYQYVYNNPIKHTDPTGMAADWYPEYDEETNKINLVREEGDDLGSLLEWSNGSFDENELIEAYLHKDGDKVDITDFGPVSDFVEGFSADKDEFNCFSCIVNGTGAKSNWSESSQEEFQEAVVDAQGYSEESVNKESLDNAKPFQSVFGYSVPGNPEKLDHVSMSAGKDRSGVTWVLTKDGYGATLRFQKGADFTGGFNGVVSPDKIYNPQ